MKVCQASYECLLHLFRAVGNFAIITALLEPRMCQGLLGCDTLFIILYKHLLDQILEIICESIRHIELGLIDFPVQLFASITIEGKLSCHHEINNDTHRPHVTLLVVMAVQHLRSHEIGSTSHYLILVLRIELARQPKVNEFYRALTLFLVVKHDILGLNVAMNDAAGMDVTQRTQQIMNNLLDILLLAYKLNIHGIL